MQPSTLGAEYDKLLDSLPATETQVLAAARALEIQGDADQACALLEKALSRHTSVHLRKSLAALHQKHGRFDKSAAIIERVLADDPADVPSVLLLAEAQIKSGRHGAARQTLRRAESLGASKLRLFKLEQQLDDPPEATEPDGSATGPAPPLERETRADGEIDEATTEPNAPAAGPPPTPSQMPSDTSESSVFEDGTFSNLSSFDLAEGAAQLQGDNTPSIFDTLVDGYEDDPADRSFDDLLMDLGVPVEEDAPTDPDATGARVRRGDGRVASQWGLDEPEAGAAGPEDATGAIDLGDLRSDANLNRTFETASPPERTPRLHESPRLNPNEPLGDDDFADEKTEMFEREPRSEPEFSEEPPTHLESPQPKPPPPRQPRQESRDQAGKRPLPPSVRQGREARRRPTARNQAVDPEPKRRPTPMQSQGVEHQTQATPADGFLRQHLKIIIPAIGLTLVLAAGGVLFAASSSATSAVGQHVDAYRAAVVPDTYRGYLQGEAELEQALRAQSFLGASLDETLAGVGLMGDARAARDDALVELARLEAMLEYRYEHLDSRQSSAAIERAEAAVSGDPRVDVAKAYRLLTSGRPDEAAELLKTTRKNFPDFLPATIALVRAQLDADSVQSATMTAAVLQQMESLSVHQHYVLGLVEHRQGKEAADARFRHLLETLSPQHVSARIVRSYTIRLGGADEDNDKARAMLEEVLGAMRESASPMQRARARVALGEVFSATDAHARAEEQFRKAIEAVPSRSSIYPPLIQLYLEDGRLDKALELIDDAGSKGAKSPDLVLRRAAIFRLTGRPDSALEVLGEEQASSARALWIKGLALLDLARPDEAAKAFEEAAAKNEEFAPARAYLLMTEELVSRSARDELSDELERMLDKFSTDADVLRAGALAAMHVAKTSKSRKARRDLLDQAERLLEQAMDKGGNQAVLLFDLCRQQMLDGDGRNAAISCGKARRINDTYLPGLLTTVDLELRRGHADAALELLDKAANRFPDEPRISQWKALAHLNRFEIERAEKAINRWAGTEFAKSPLHRRVEGRIAFARNRYTSALGYFQRSLEKAPDDARVELEYAHTLTRLGDYGRALPIVRKHTTDLEWEPLAWLIYGEIRRRQGRFGDARENLGLALSKLDDQLAPPWRISQAYTQLALAWADRYGFSHRFVGRYLYRGKKRGNADFPPLNATRGLYYMKQRRPDRRKAADAFEKVIEFEPFNCSALNALRPIYEELQTSDELERVDRLHKEHCED